MTGLLPQPVPRSVSALTALRIHHDFARQPAGSGIEPQCAVLRAKSFVHSVEHRTKVKWMVVRSGVSCQELCRSAAEMLTPGEKGQSNRNTFPSWLYFATAIQDVMRLTVPIQT